MNNYLDKVDLVRFTDRINESFRGRIKYKGTLPIIPTGQTTRGDWSDIAPCYVGHAYVLTGSAEQYIVIDDIRYNVGDLVFATNEVTKDSSGGLSAAVTVQKISGVANPRIDNKTIIENQDPTYSRGGDFMTAVGGWTETSKNQLAAERKLTLDAVATEIKVPAKAYPTNGESVMITMVYPSGGSTSESGTYDSYTKKVTTITYYIESDETTSPYITIKNKDASAFAAGSYSVKVSITKATDVESIHTSDPKYIEKDNYTVVIDDLGSVKAKSAIEINTFPDFALAKTEVLYRLLTNQIISGKQYPAGLYVCDKSDAANPQWLSVGGTKMDEKTIKTKNLYGSNVVPAHTEIGGSLLSKDGIGAGPFITSITTDANGELINVANIINKSFINAIMDAGVFSTETSYQLNFTKDSKDICVDNIKLVKYPTEKESIQNSSFELKGDYIDIIVSYDGTNYNGTINASKEIGLAANTTYTNNYLCFNINPIYSYVNNNYLNLDNTTITDINPLDRTAGPLHAKSAIEVATFPVTGILPETIYRLTAEITIGDKKYAPGLYVYDTTDAANPIWLSVGGSEVDEKTVLSKDDDGNLTQLHTRVGGWLDRTDVSSNTKTTTLTDTESTYTFTDTKMDGIWGVKAPAKVTVTITEKDTTTVILDMKLNIAEVAGWENTFSFSTADIGFVVTRNPGVDFTIKMIHHTAAYSKEVDVVFTVDASVIHHLDTDYIKIDKETIVSKKVLSTDEVKTLRAKSALEVDSLSGVTSPLTETIYRLTTEETISGKKYAKGLYVYDISGTTPVWLSVGGSEVDEKTILSTDDNGEHAALHTRVGGWLEDTTKYKDLGTTTVTSEGKAFDTTMYIDAGGGSKWQVGVSTFEFNLTLADGTKVIETLDCVSTSRMENSTSGSYVIYDGTNTVYCVKNTNLHVGDVVNLVAKAKEEVNEKIHHLDTDYINIDSKSIIESKSYSDEVGHLETEVGGWHEDNWINIVSSDPTLYGSTGIVNGVVNIEYTKTGFDYLAKIISEKKIRNGAEMLLRITDNTDTKIIAEIILRLSDIVGDIANFNWIGNLTTVKTGAKSSTIVYKEQSAGSSIIPELNYRGVIKLLDDTINEAPVRYRMFINDKIIHNVRNEYINTDEKTILNIQNIDEETGHLETEIGGWKEDITDIKYSQNLVLPENDVEYLFTNSDLENLWSNKGVPTTIKLLIKQVAGSNLVSADYTLTKKTDWKDSFSTDDNETNLEIIRISENNFKMIVHMLGDAHVGKNVDATVTINGKIIHKAKSEYINNDGKTILNIQDTGEETGHFETQIGGWKDVTTINESVRKEIVLETGTKSYVFSDPNFSKSWFNKYVPSSLYHSVVDKNSGYVISRGTRIITKKKDWDDTIQGGNGDFSFYIRYYKDNMFEIKTVVNSTLYTDKTMVFDLSTTTENAKHSIDSDYLNIDGNTLYIEENQNRPTETGVLRSKPIIEASTSLEDIINPLKNTLYRVWVEQTTSDGKTYAPGLYEYCYIIGEEGWVRVSGAEVDEKTILSRDDDGELTALHTAIGGYKSDSYTFNFGTSWGLGPVSGGCGLTNNFDFEHFFFDRVEIGDKLIFTGRFTDGREQIIECTYQSVSSSPGSYKQFAITNIPGATGYLTLSKYENTETYNGSWSWPSGSVISGGTPESCTLEVVLNKKVIHKVDNNFINIDDVSIKQNNSFEDGSSKLYSVARGGLKDGKAFAYSTEITYMYDSHNYGSYISVGGFIGIHAFTSFQPGNYIFLSAYKVYDRDNVEFDVPDTYYSFDYYDYDNDYYYYKLENNQSKVNDYLRVRYDRINYDVEVPYVYFDIYMDTPTGFAGAPSRITQISISCSAARVSKIIPKFLPIDESNIYIDKTKRVLKTAAGGSIDKTQSWKFGIPDITYGTFYDTIGELVLHKDESSEKKCVVFDSFWSASFQVMIKYDDGYGNEVTRILDEFEETTDNYYIFKWTSTNDEYIELIFKADEFDSRIINLPCTWKTSKKIWTTSATNPIKSIIFISYKASNGNAAILPVDDSFTKNIIDNKLITKNYIEVSSLPTAPKEEYANKIYYLTNDTDTYKKGMYKCNINLNNITWERIGILSDEKTILSKNIAGKDVSLKTAIGGHIVSTDGTASDVIFDSLTTDSDGKVVDTSITLDKSKINILFAYGLLSTENSYSIELYDNSKCFSIDNLKLVKYSSTMQSIEESNIEFKNAYVDIKISYNGTDYIGIFNISKNLGLAPNTTYTNNKICILRNPVYSYVDNNYLDLDNITITDKNPLDKTAGSLHAKSAIEVSVLPTENILPETIYHLTKTITVGVKKYVPGLYVYDTSGTEPIWVSVGKPEVDEKTIHSTDANGNNIPLSTTVGGSIDYTIPNVIYETTLTNTYTCINANRYGVVYYRIPACGIAGSSIINKPNVYCYYKATRANGSIIENEYSLYSQGLFILENDSYGVNYISFDNNKTMVISHSGSQSDITSLHYKIYQKGTCSDMDLSYVSFADKSMEIGKGAKTLAVKHDPSLIVGNNGVTTAAGGRFYPSQGIPVSFYCNATYMYPESTWSMCMHSYLSYGYNFYSAIASRYYGEGSGSFTITIDPTGTPVEETYTYTKMTYDGTFNGYGYKYKLDVTDSRGKNFWWIIPSYNNDWIKYTFFATNQTDIDGKSFTIKQNAGFKLKIDMYIEPINASYIPYDDSTIKNISNKLTTVLGGGRTSSEVNILTTRDIGGAISCVQNNHDYSLYKFGNCGITFNDLQPDKEMYMAMTIEWTDGSIETLEIPYLHNYNKFGRSNGPYVGIGLDGRLDMYCKLHTAYNITNLNVRIYLKNGYTYINPQFIQTNKSLTVDIDNKTLLVNHNNSLITDTTNGYIKTAIGGEYYPAISNASVLYGAVKVNNGYENGSDLVIPYIWYGAESNNRLYKLADKVSITSGSFIIHYKDTDGVTELTETINYTSASYDGDYGTYGAKYKIDVQDSRGKSFWWVMDKNDKNTLTAFSFVTNQTTINEYPFMIEQIKGSAWPTWNRSEYRDPIDARYIHLNSNVSEIGTNGDSGLIATENGLAVKHNIYYGTTVPAASDYKNGDIYIQYVE